MKKCLVLFLILIIVFSFGSVFAVENNQLTKEDGKKIVEFLKTTTSEDYTSSVSGMSDTNVNKYRDYFNAMTEKDYEFIAECFYKLMESVATKYKLTLSMNYENSINLNNFVFFIYVSSVEEGYFNIGCFPNKMCDVLDNAPLRYILYLKSYKYIKISTTVNGSSASYLDMIRINIENQTYKIEELKQTSLYPKIEPTIDEETNIINIPLFTFSSGNIKYLIHNGAPTSHTEDEYQNLVIKNSNILEDKKISGAVVSDNGEKIIYSSDTDTFTYSIENIENDLTQIFIEAYGYDSSSKTLNNYPTETITLNDYLSLRNHSLSGIVMESDLDENNEYNFKVNYARLTNTSYIYRVCSGFNRFNSDGINVVNSASEYFSIAGSDLHDVLKDNYVILDVDVNKPVDPDNPDKPPVVEPDEPETPDYTGAIEDVGNKIDELGNKVEETGKGIIASIREFFTEMFNNILEFFTNLVDTILDGIINLFIPDEEMLKSWVTKTQNDIEASFGMLGYPMSFFVDLMNELASTTPSDLIFKIPDISLPGSDINFVNAFDFNVSETVRNIPAVNLIYQTYIVIVSGISVYMFLSYLWSLFEAMLGSKDVEAAPYDVLVETETNKPIGFGADVGNYSVKRKARIHRKGTR